MDDIIVVGAGPAGMTAAIYASRKAYSTRVISHDTGGQALWSSGVENYTGFRFITGMDLVRKFEEHMKVFPIKHTFAEVRRIEAMEKGFRVMVAEGDGFEARSVIVATGKSHRRLDVPGEKEFIGRGVAYCAICDAPLFSGLPVAVIGGGNSGLQAALQLSRIASSVIMVEGASQVAGDAVYLDRLSAGAGDRFQLLLQTRVVKIEGDSMVRSMTVAGPEGERRLLVNGIFVEVGWQPNSSAAADLVKLNAKGEIMVDCFGNTSRPGIAAAGDVTTVPKQIIIAAGEGAKAALAANEYLLRLQT